MHARKPLIVLFLVLLISLVLIGVPMRVRVAAQQPTGSVPTVTGTPVGATVSVDPSLEQIDVWAGPSTFNYSPIGVLLTGVKVPALGRARGDQNWIMIRYEGVPGAVGWVYALYVSLNGAGEQGLPLVDIPPTPTALYTPTIDPVLAATFLPTGNVATSLPTFTAPAPLAIPTFVEAQQTSRVPIGLLIFGFAVVGALGTTISFLRGR